MSSFVQKSILVICSFFLVTVATFAPFTPVFHFQKAEADVVRVTNNFALESTQRQNVAINQNNAAVNSLNQVANSWLALKEGALDGYAWYALEIVLSEMIRSVTAWVNAGFPEGGPSFVRDFRGFMLNIADGLVGDFILDNTKFGFMCSPFSLDIRFAIAGQYLEGRSGEGYQPKCRMTDIVNNIRNFTVNIDGSIEVAPSTEIGAAYNSGSFYDGGWAWWMESTVHAENNVYGNLERAQNAMAQQLREAQQEKVFELDVGRGFLSFRKCDPPGSDNCPITTPGAVIQQSLQTALDAPTNRLLIADEINELISALLSQLMQKVMGELGLFGLSFQPFNPGEADSFMDKLQDEIDNGGATDREGFASDLNIDYSEVQDNAQDYRDANQDVLDRIGSYRQRVYTETEYLARTYGRETVFYNYQPSHSAPGGPGRTAVPLTQVILGDDTYIEIDRSLFASERNSMDRVLSTTEGLPFLLSELATAEAASDEDRIAEVRTEINRLLTEDPVPSATIIDLFVETRDITVMADLDEREARFDAIVACIREDERRQEEAADDPDITYSPRTCDGEI